jgi:hypothetical protein
MTEPDASPLEPRSRRRAARHLFQGTRGRAIGSPADRMWRSDRSARPAVSGLKMLRPMSQLRLTGQPAVSGPVRLPPSGPPRISGSRRRPPIGGPGRPQPLLSRRYDAGGSPQPATAQPRPSPSALPASSTLLRTRRTRRARVARQRHLGTSSSSWWRPSCTSVGGCTRAYPGWRITSKAHLRLASAAEPVARLADGPPDPQWLVVPADRWRRSQPVSATARQASLMVSSIRGSVEGGC